MGDIGVFQDRKLRKMIWNLLQRATTRILAVNIVTILSITFDELSEILVVWCMHDWKLLEKKLFMN